MPCMAFVSRAQSRTLPINPVQVSRMAELRGAFRGALHEFSSSERLNICARQLEPFPVPAPALKSLVPVFFDSWWVICANRMYGVWFLGKLDTQLVLPSSG